MKSITDSIIEILKQELEQNNSSDNYSQWIVGVSIRKERGKDRIIGKPVYITRVVFKTSESHIEGMDIAFMAPEDDVIIEANYLENTTKFQCETLEDAIKWLEQSGEIHYLQLTNPYKLDIYIKRLENIIREYSFDDLIEYTIDIRTGTNLNVLYQDLIQKTIQGNVTVDGREISDGKYVLKVRIGNNEYTLYSKAWYTINDVIKEIKDNVLLPLLEMENKEADKYDY